MPDPNVFFKGETLLVQALGFEVEPDPQFSVLFSSLYFLNLPDDHVVVAVRQT